MQFIENYETAETVKSDYSSAYLDFGIYGLGDSFAVISFFERSEQAVRSIGSSLTLGKGIIFKNRTFAKDENFSVFYYRIQVGKSRFWHCMAVNKGLNEHMFLCDRKNKEDALYDFLMRRYNLPLMREWKEALFRRLDGHMIAQCQCQGKTAVSGCGTNLGTRFIENRCSKIPLSDLTAYSVGNNEKLLISVVEELLRDKRICITEQEMKPLIIKNQDSYFKDYGVSIVENMKKVVVPENELDGNIDIVFNTKSMFPQQIAVVNAQAKHLINNRSALVTATMGTGKTLMGMGIVEKYFIDKAMRKGTIKNIKDAYRDSKSINYRVLIMCPGHLVSKWQEEVLKEIPFAKATILTDFSQLVELERRGPKRSGREFYLLSKDFCKLSYQEVPVPKKIQRKYVSVRKCAKCDSVIRNGVCGSCGEKTESVYVRSRIQKEGLVCPYCNELLFAQGAKVDELASGEKADLLPLMPFDFSSKTNKNSRCYYCDGMLWKPYVENTKLPFQNNRHNEPVWYRGTFYKDKAHNGRTTIWVYRGYEDDYIMEYGEMLNDMSEKEAGTRKYAPSLFINKKLKNYFDFSISDEVHKFKGGGSAQGAAFQHILNASKKNISLTGTLTGGTAADVFYLFYRLFPKMMVSMGFGWNDLESFSEKYGVVEKKYEYVGSEEVLNISSRGKQLVQPSVKPGISPRLFLKILDKATFLDISDLSSHMPKFVENVVMTNIVEKGSEEEKKMLDHYLTCIDKLKRSLRAKGGSSLLGAMNVFEMSYLDKPYGAKTIINPSTGEKILEPRSYDNLVSGNRLLAKEKDLIDIMRRELAEGRNCVVYAEYTGKEETNITQRLKDIIMRECRLQDNEVIIMKASSPSSAKRESWMHKMAEEGMKVMICNPSLVETGLDFCWIDRNGKMYNYPTLIYFQMGTSLYKILQSSRRAWRLNQTQECRNYYMGIARTKQQAMIQLIAEKTAANGVMQGRFSVDGLAAMAEGIDVDLRLAQIMSEMDNTTVNEIQNMFDAVNNLESSDEELYGEYKKQLLYAQLMGDEAKKIDKNVFDIFSSFSSFDSLAGLKTIAGKQDGSGQDKPAADKPKPKNNDFNSFFFINFPNGGKVKKSDSQGEGAQRKTKKGRKAASQPMYSLFDMD